MPTVAPPGGVFAILVRIRQTFKRPNPTGFWQMGIDIVADRLEKMRSYGADYALNASGKDARQMADELKAIRKSAGLPAYGWKIFEATGTQAGQETALNLLSFTGRASAWPKSPIRSAA